MTILDNLHQRISEAKTPYPIGFVGSVGDGAVRIDGLKAQSRIGDLVQIRTEHNEQLNAEIMRIDAQGVWALPETPPEGLSLGDVAQLRKQPDLRPCDAWIGRVIDPFGRPLDDLPLMQGPDVAQLHASPPAAARRKPFGARMACGVAALNTILPIARGQRIGLFAGSGVGKSRLLGHLTKNMQADLVVLALVGERGREVGDFVQRILGPEGMQRAIVVAATSDKSALMRRRCAWSAMAVAEHFRDQGKSIIFLMDSVTRFAEAHREVALASGETSTDRGFPPSTLPAIANLCERAGPGTQDQGDITAVFSVLVAGSDMEEPLADMLRGVLDGHLVLSRDIAERGRYPAIDLGKSVSRSLPEAASTAENAIIQDARKLLGAYEKSETMIRAGLYAAGTDRVLDRAIKIWPELDQFCARQENETIENSFAKLQLLLRQG